MVTAPDVSAVTKSTRRAYCVLRITFTAIPIITGVDQFTNKLTNWDMYLAPLATRIFPFSAHTLMMIAGVVEIVAGLIVAFRPRIGGWLVAIWLWLITINLLIATGFYDTALRDIGLSLGAVALALLSADFGRRNPPANG